MADLIKSKGNTPVVELISVLATNKINGATTTAAVKELSLRKTITYDQSRKRCHVMLRLPRWHLLL